MGKSIEEVLRDFLYTEKLRGYASGDEGKVLDDGGKEFTFESWKVRDFFYRDRYYGFNPFVGEELVWHRKKLIWAMNYYGATTDDRISPEDFFKFLREALRLMSPQIPYRGPRFHQGGDFTYLNEWQGRIDMFRGTEFILWKGQQVYKGEYHGGFVKNKT